MVKALLLGVFLGIIIFLGMSVAELYSRASNMRMENGVVVSAGKVDLRSLTAVRYSGGHGQLRDDDIYETIVIHKPYLPMIGGDQYFFYKNGELYRAEIGNNSINRPNLLQEMREDADKLLAETRQKFADVIPLE